MQNLDKKRQRLAQQIKIIPLITKFDSSALSLLRKHIIVCTLLWTKNLIDHLSRPADHHHEYPEKYPYYFRNHLQLVMPLIYEVLLLVFKTKLSYVVDSLQKNDQLTYNHCIYSLHYPNKKAPLTQNIYYDLKTQNKHPT